MPRLQNERSITERLAKAAVIPAGSGVVLGIGDDCAIYRPRGSAEDLLFTTDLFIQDIHFHRETHKPGEAGRKALARSLSDIAAMGGAARFCLVALSIPEWANGNWVNRFFDGLLEAAKTAGVALAGGDLSRGEKLTCDVMVCGGVPRGKALLRSGARAGDEIYVSGLLGGSALGLETRSGKAWKRHVRPEPRGELGKFLREKLKATSAIDLSDGLSLDLRRICLASGVAAEITDPPVFRGATLDQALHGGEDYELLFTAGRSVRVPSNFGKLPLTRIGRILKGPSGSVTWCGGPLPPMGYDHFSKR